MDENIFEFKSAEEMNRWLCVNYATSDESGFASSGMVLG